MSFAAWQRSARKFMNLGMQRVADIQASLLRHPGLCGSFRGRTVSRLSNSGESDQENSHDYKKYVLGVPRVAGDDGHVRCPSSLSRRGRAGGNRGRAAVAQVATDEQ